MSAMMSGDPRARKVLARQSVFDLPLEAIKTPVLVLGHAADNCERSPAGLMEKITARTQATRKQAVTVTGGPITVELEYTITGIPGTTSVYFSSAGSRTVVLGTGDGTQGGAATVHDTAFGLSDQVNWMPPSSCLPAPATSPPSGPPEYPID